MRILLTGSTGQVGHALLHSLSPYANIFAPTRAQCDLSLANSVRDTIQQYQPELIINCAAYTAVDNAETESALAYTINAIAPQIMAQEAKKLGVGLIHFSTDYVFDGQKVDSHNLPLAYRESDATNPCNEYGKTKLAGELAIQASGCQHLILRTSWVYSLFGKNFLLTILQLAKQREELFIVNDQWGVPTSAAWLAATTSTIVRQLIHVTKVANVTNVNNASNSNHAKNQESWWSNHQGLYHMTANGKTSWQGFTEEIMRMATQLQILEKTVPIIHGITSNNYPTLAKRPLNSCLDTSKFAKQFSIEIPTWQTVLLDLLSTPTLIKNLASNIDNVS